MHASNGFQTNKPTNQHTLLHPNELDGYPSQDENKDGLFTVGELIQWIETNKLVQFVKEGRDAEMEEIIVSHEKDKDDDNNKMDVLEDTTAKSSSKSK